jgi:hypothetical protein
MYQPHCSLAPVPSAQDALDVCLQALESGKDSGDTLHDKIRLVGLLSHTVRGQQLGECCAALITGVRCAKDERIRETCTTAIAFRGAVKTRLRRPPRNIRGHFAYADEITDRTEEQSPSRSAVMTALRIVWTVDGTAGLELFRRI